jgi:hypothetical protein
MGDDDRELRSIALAAFPCPPLPLLGSRVNDGFSQTDFSSHDLIAQFLQICMKVCTDAQHDARRNAQLHALDQYVNNIVSCVDPKTMGCEIHAVYAAMCNYTRVHIITYLPWMPDADIRFLPISQVCKGDVVHKGAVEHLLAQQLLYNYAEKATTEDLQMLEYPSLLKVSFLRAVFV